MYVHIEVNLPILFASSSDSDYLFKKPLQIYILHGASLSLHIPSAIGYPYFLYGFYGERLDNEYVKNT